MSQGPPAETEDGQRSGTAASNVDAPAAGGRSGAQSGQRQCAKGRDERRRSRKQKQVACNLKKTCQQIALVDRETERGINANGIENF